METMPNARILLLSANILYGTNLSHELKNKFGGEKVGFYKDPSDDLSGKQIVVCSFESLNRVRGQAFELMLIDEVRTVGGLVGGDTMPFFENVYLLQHLSKTTPRVVVCDADLLFRVDETEETPAGKGFVEYLAGGRRVVCAELTHKGPDHLRRSARFFFDSKKAKVGKREWFDEIKLAAAEWRNDHSKRFAICVGNATSQMTEICRLLKFVEKVPHKPYSGKTRQDHKLNDLKDPDAVWIEFGCIVSTTSLSIGVDPKSTSFARVFVWTCRTGCNLLTMFQAAQRYGRSEKAPMSNTTVDILLHCVPPTLGHGSRCG